MGANILSSSGEAALPVAPSMGPVLEEEQFPQRPPAWDLRAIYICALSMAVGAAASAMAWVLEKLIALLTHLCFEGRWSAGEIGPLHAHPWVILLVPVLGAVIIGLMARFGSRGVAGHGIPEAMEQVLTNRSRIPVRMTFLKPLSAAISIGTGGPYGAEGPIIATGGALGSLVGQMLSTTAAERKILLAAGAAAGIAAAFNSPIAGVLLAVELLLFEFRPRSLVPIALACAVASSLHILVQGSHPFFIFNPGHTPLSQSGVLIYLAIGCFAGIGSVILTRTVYAVEHFFNHVPIHWMWHPALGAILVGAIGCLQPRTLGSGYFNIDDLIANRLALTAILLLGIAKFLSWTISLGSGTAGGTLAPVFTIGGALGAALGLAAAKWFPGAGISVGMAALVGMTAIFAGVSRALLTSIVFAIEATLQPAAILPVLAGCTMAYLVSMILMRHSMMTVKMEKQGVRVPEEFAANVMDQIRVEEAMARQVVTLRSDQTLETARAWLTAGKPGSQHQGFPLVDETGLLIGVLTRRDLSNEAHDGNHRLESLLRRPPSLVYSDCSLREAADHMVRHDIGRLPVIDRESRKLVGFITRGDLLTAQMRRLHEAEAMEKGSLFRRG